VPALFLYRDPIEVIVSNLQNIPEWMTVGSNPAVSALVLGVRLEDLGSIGPEEFCARALGRFYSAASSALDENTLLCNYQDLTPETLLRLVEFFRVSISTEEAKAIRQTCEVYSKDPARPFEGDNHSKRANASQLVIEMAAKWAETPYQSLVSLQEQMTATNNLVAELT
jgi:hypothetical protein